MALRVDEGYWWIAITLTILLAMFTLQQIIISDLGASGPMSARVAVFVTLAFELSILLLEYLTIVRHSVRDPMIADQAFSLFLFWGLVLFRSFSVYKVVYPPKLYAHEKWATALHRIWMFLSFVLSVFIVATMIMFVSTTDILYIRICRSGSNLYVISAALMTLIISLRIIQRIRESSKTLKSHTVQNSSGSQGHLEANSKLAFDVDSTSPTINIVETQTPNPVSNALSTLSTENSLQTLSKFMRAKRVVTIRMVFCCLLIPSAVGATYSVITHDFPKIERHRHDRIFVRFGHRDAFLIYYILFLLLYLSIILNFFTSMMANECIWKWLEQHCCDRDPNSIVMAGDDPKMAKKIKLKSPNVHNPRSSAAVVRSHHFDAANISNLNENEIDFDDSELVFHAFSNCTAPNTRNDNGSQETEDVHSPDDNRQRPSIKKIGTGAALSLAISYTAGDAEMSPNLAPIETSLTRINSKGEEIGKRGATKLVKHKDKMKKEGAMSPIDVKTVALWSGMNSVKSAGLNDNGDSIGRMISDFQPIQPSGLTPGGSSSASTSASTMSPTISEEVSVSTVLFELEHVLCTNCTKISRRTFETLKFLSATEKELAFGGRDRIAMLSKFLTKLCASNGGTRCFIVAQQESRMVLQLLRDVGLLAFFVSRRADNPKKFNSHILGTDHQFMVQAEGKMHLLLLRMMHFLETTHDEMLFIGHDWAEIDHLDNIKVGKTYWCETKGLTLGDLNAVSQLYL